MSDFSSYRLKELFPISIPGEWGSEPVGGGNAFVLRAADFTKDCKLRPEIGVLRNIPVDKLSARLLKNGDLLIEKSGGSPEQPVGRVALFDRENEYETYCYSNFLQLLRTVDWLNSRFAHYLMLFSYQQGLVFKYQQQTTGIINLKLEDYLKEEVMIPISPVVRDKISKILHRIDQTIEKTEALIDKYQRIKAGLMHDLFTRGVSADGKLRPTRDQAPDLYQETPIGWMPEGWSCETLESLLAPLPNNLRSGPFGSALLKSELVEDGIPFLGIDNIHVEEFREDYRRFVSSKKYRELAKYSVRPRDVIITIMGTVGRCAVAPDNIDKALSSKHLWTMTFNQERVIPELICWQLNYAAWVKAWFRRETQGGIMDAIQSKTLKTLRLPVPSKEEQNLIFERYRTLTQKVDSERENLEKLQKQKLGLMQDLLTGKVPVTVEEPEAAHV